MTIEEFCKSLPKLELHAHLNGSLSEKTLKELGCLDESLSEFKKFLNIINKTERTLDECFVLFNISQAVTSNKRSVYLATKSIIEEFADDNVIYLELRTTPRAEDGMSKEDYVTAVLKAIADKERDIIVKLILSINRGHDAADSQDSLYSILKMAKKYPDIIKGIDLSGNPYGGKFEEQLFRIAKENGLYTAIHCAEIRNDKEVEEILNFGPDRIGHATFLHPKYGGSQENWELYCRKIIPIECCLTSNIVCGTSRNYKEHHVQEWIKNDLPFSINEYEYASRSFDLSRNDLWSISYNAIDHSFASTEEKNLLKVKLEDWKQTNKRYF
ncbi:hypothetical protein NQ314_019856 [Rhamnusium bicolor]|uniref:Adenosine deaminase domain-containing protein n=1 Tax=Rhamnusium bicolor TaxID=1586634 RepID=A0AAV8WLN5_9CUCU|nr:hypothetical protein NQ314_019856 [Rhamnusium bicolor]